MSESIRDLPGRPRGVHGRRAALGSLGVGSLWLAAACGGGPPTPEPTANVAPTPTPEPTATPTLTPRPTPEGLLEIVEHEVAVEREALCTPVTELGLERAELFAITMPFDEPSCRSMERFFDIRQVEQGAGVYVPTHTARLQPGARLVAPVGGQISVSKMQQDTAAGLHLYGAGAIWIRIQPTDPAGRSVPHSPVVHLYIPGDSEIAADFAHFPGTSENLQMGRREIIVERLGETLLDPERTEDHNLIMFLETGRGFVELFTPGAEMFLVSGAPRI